MRKLERNSTLLSSYVHHLSSSSSSATQEVLSLAHLALERVEVIEEKMKRVAEVGERGGVVLLLDEERMRVLEEVRRDLTEMQTRQFSLGTVVGAIVVASFTSALIVWCAVRGRG